jgi:hypothetical protein
MISPKWSISQLDVNILLNNIFKPSGIFLLPSPD